MALNIESGSTWAEIRAHLNEESINIESGLKEYCKEYSDSLFEFSPGTLSSIDFGLTAVINGDSEYSFGENKIFINDKGLVYCGEIGTKDESTLIPVSSMSFEGISNFEYIPLTSGKIKAKIRISSIISDAYYWNSTGGGAWKSMDLDDITSIKCNLKISIKPNSKSENILIFEEKDIIINEDTKYSFREIDIDSLSVIKGEPITLIAELTYVELVTEMQDRRACVNKINFHMYGGIENSLFGTTSDDLGVWADE